MSGLLGVNEELKVFKCPNCSQYISSKNDVCPKCSFPISDEIKQSAIATQDNEVKEANRKFYKTVLYTGLGSFGVGALIVLASAVTVFYAERARVSIWGPFLTLLGIGQIIYAVNGLRKEK